MIRRIFRIVAAAAFFAAILHPPALASERLPFNLSSHTPEFFRDLLSGRVWVYESNSKPAAAYLGKNQDKVDCWFQPSRNKYLRTYPDATWAITGNQGRVFIKTTNAGKTYTRVPFYAPDTGRYHTEAPNKELTHWQIVTDGWIQNEWPRILLDRCPELGLPHDLPINENQASIQFSDVEANATPVRNHPGSDMRFPGATGLGASNGQPTLTVEQVEETLRQYNRHIAIGMQGRKLVFFAQSDHHEIWHLDADSSILDVGIMRLSPDGKIMKTRWDKTGRTSKNFVGYALPTIPTDRLHPVFAMMGQLTATARPVTLPSITTTPDAHVFASDGTVRTPHSAGSWHISRGAVHVDIDGVKRAYPWKDFAQRAGWTG
ncbi:MAG: hypothetical protein OXI64_05935 [Defluviicoccus sp.]|nr:hypothetical protein [Defluviicoccus sp.]MDE0334480.1 hypothetical protein [Defluviicoccus sp.]